jgi:hypothetical protein
MDMKGSKTRAPAFWLIWIAASMTVATAVAREKPVGSWADVQKLKAGREVEAMLSNSSRLRGRVVSTADDALVLRVDGADRSLERAGLCSVAVQERKTAKGAMIGLLVGLAFAYPNAVLQGGGAAAGGIAVYTAAGAGIGALAKGYRTVYRAPAAGPPAR